MFPIVNQHTIENSKLDKGNYFQSLFSEACKKNILDDGHIERMQLELVELMSKQVERYTNDESSSVKVETAQQLFQSICYSMGSYLKSVPDMIKKTDLLKNEKISVLFYHGMAEIESNMTKGTSLLTKLQKNKLKVDNYAYQDTLMIGIPEFFHDYVIEFEAHENPGSIDYPLCKEIGNLSGIEYICEYLSRLTIENNFCKNFSDTNIEMLLRGYSKDYMHVLVNIYELVLTNALGCEMMEQRVIDLNITSIDRIWLRKNLEKLNVNELREKLLEAYEKICIELGLEKNRTNYAKQAIKRIAARLHHNLKSDTLEKIFITIIEEDKKEEFLYEDGKQMEDDSLRKFIEEMKECRYTVDKIAMLRREVHSLYDLMELMEESFFDHEYDQVFELLNEAELTILRETIVDEQENESLKGTNSLKEWQKKLLSYKT